MNRDEKPPEKATQRKTAVIFYHFENRTHPEQIVKSHKNPHRIFGKFKMEILDVLGRGTGGSKKLARNFEKIFLNFKNATTTRGDIKNFNLSRGKERSDVMTVKELTNRCYDTIIIYTSLDDDYTEFKDLYKGTKENIPKDLLNKEVQCFGAKRTGVIEISISKRKKGTIL